MAESKTLFKILPPEEFPPRGANNEIEMDNPTMPGMAVIVSDGPDRCYLAHYIGFVLGNMIDVCGDDVTCLGFDGLDAGIWIWEGTYSTTRDYWGEYDTEAVGDFRKPTDEEFELIKGEESPWDDSDWEVKDGEICWNCFHPAHDKGECSCKSPTGYTSFLAPCKCEWHQTEDPR